MPNIYADIALAMLDFIKVPLMLGLGIFAVKFAAVLGFRMFKQTLTGDVNFGDMYATPNPRRNPANWVGSTYIGPKR